ncbi:MAG: hypothetical protein K2I23_07305, partial [Clostridia bacterium]|nr:hypothetical protein [Clostridia bacterium]
AKAGLSSRQLNALHFDATFQEVKINRSWLSLAGDVDATSSDVSIGYKFISFETEEDFSIGNSSGYTSEGEYKVKDAGRYVLGIEIVAPNHEPYTSQVNLNVTPATVIINMTQASKTYGDKIEDLNAADPTVNTDTLSRWIKHNCGITVTSYIELGGGRRTEKDITTNAIDDFIFYVAGSNNEALDFSSYQLDVGEYRVYHRMNEEREYEDGSVGALASNYVVEYYQEPGAKDNCNADAYKITPRGVDVTWEISSENWDSDPEIKNYYYTGRNPSIVAKFYALPDANNVVQSETLQFIGTRSPNVGEYTLQVTRSEWNNNVSNNYTINAGSDKFTYNIVKRPITVTITNQSAGEYGSANGGYEITQEEYTVYDEFAKKSLSSLEDSPIELVLDNKGIAANKFLPAGSYTISGICLNANYDVEWVNGTLTVDEAELDLRASYTYEDVTYLGKDITLDFKKILPVRNTTFVPGDDWRDAWADAEITYADDPVFTGAGAVSVGYTLKVANYKEFTGVVVVDIQVATVNVSISEVSSIYGDGLLNSEEIFANAEITLAEGSAPIEIDVNKIIELFVDSSAVKAGRYDLDFSYVDGQDNNFDVNLVDNVGKYIIKPRPVKLVWGMDEGDSSLESDGKYVFDGKPHKIIFGIDEDDLVDGDVINPRFEETSQKDQAGTYYARLISIGTNANYTLPEDCTYEWTIKPRQVSVTWTVEEYIYDGTPKAPVAQLNAEEILLGTSCGVTVTDGEINAGDYIAVASATSSNYEIIGAEMPFTIKPRQIQVVWSNDSFVYDGKNHAPTASVMEGELLEGDMVSEITVGGAQTNAGTYTATVAGLDNNNYVVVGATKNFTIEKKQVTIHWTDTQFDYTGAEITPNAKLEGVLTGDSVDLEVSGGKTDVGTYTATAIGVNNGNYVLAPNTVKEMEFTIDKVDNEFDGLYGKGDSKEQIVGIPWAGENAPTNKFGGEVVIKYYEDEDCTKEIDVNKIKDGTYWAVAYVAGTDNYNELVSSPLEFTIDNGVNIALAVSGIVISVVLLGAVLTIILVINKKKKGGRA